MVLSNYPVNRTDFRVIRGVQNEILFFVRNLDRNAVDTTAFQTVTITISDPESATLLMTRNLTVVNADTALYKLTILPSETADWDLGTLRWSLSVTRNDDAVVPLWTDMNYGSYSTLEVTEGALPGATPARILDPSGFTLLDNVAYSSALPGAAQLGYQNGLHTFAIYPTVFTGSVQIDGSLEAQPAADSWFTVSVLDFVASSVLDTIDTIGNYLWLRIQVRTLSGSISQILYKN